MQEWHVRTNPTKYPDLFTYTILEKNPDYVMGKPNSFREFSVAFELDSKENAYLISSAPDMYKALTMLLNYAMIHEVKGVIYPEGSHEEWISKAKLAIAKARGEI